MPQQQQMKKGKVLQRRSVTFIIDADEATADQMADAILLWMKTQYKLPQHCLEVSKRSVVVRNYLEVDEK